MADAPLVSIVIPAFNAGRWLEETLRSCAAQSYEHYEVIVVDDGSTDDTAAIAERDAARPGSRTRVVRAPENAGLGATRNRGVREARGELFFYLDADDLIEPNALRCAVELMRAEDAQAVVGAWYDFTSDPQRPNHKVDRPFVYPQDPVASLLLNPVVISAVLLPRSDVAWDEHLVSWEGQRYFMDVLPGLSRIAQLRMPMVRVRQRLDSERLTIKHNHFEPLHAIAFYADLKTRLRGRDQLTALREEAIDAQLLKYLYSARQSGHLELDEQCRSIDARRLPGYAWHRPLGLSGFAARLGVRRGLEAFYWVNRVLRRTTH